METHVSSQMAGKHSFLAHLQSDSGPHKGNHLMADLTSITTPFSSGTFHSCCLLFDVLIFTQSENVLWYTANIKCNENLKKENFFLAARESKRGKRVVVGVALLSRLRLQSRPEDTLNTVFFVLLNQDFPPVFLYVVSDKFILIAVLTK